MNGPQKTGRPHMPGYGISPAGAGARLLPWSWAVERLAAAHNYWLATGRPDGRPHLAAVWGVWDDGRFWFSTSGGSRKARNLRADPRCVVTPERAEESVVLEGLAQHVTDGDRLTALQEVYVGKYGEGFPDPEANPVFAVRPVVVLGVIERYPDFVKRATRWEFQIAE